ncbi:MAG: glycosyltransferase family 2 protein [Clostridia bacterium]|nr:glycosyltransferase family 2 protein [Clostridia bacterium]
MISVIVPVYKTEKYLRKCVDSILAQTYTDLEIILVDDGSPDNCGRICDEYAGMDPRVKVIHRANGGLSAARNSGLDIARGEYVAFIDSDDYIDHGYLETLVSCLTDGADMSICGFIKETENGEPITLYGNGSGESVPMSHGQAFSALCGRRLFGFSAWGKLVRRDIAAAHPFPEGRLFEDVFTVYKYIGDSCTTVYTGKAVYHYVAHSGSITHSGWNGRYYDLMDASREFVDYIDANYPALHSEAVFRYFLSANTLYKFAYSSPDYVKTVEPCRKSLRVMRKGLDMKKIPVNYRIKFMLMIVSPRAHRLLNTVLVSDFVKKIRK